VSSTQRFGAGIWHFATYVDRYATDGYGDPRTILDAIALAGQVEDLSVVDLNWPFFGGDFSNEQVGRALADAGLSVIGITPEIYTRRFRKGSFTNPDPGVRRLTHELVTQACDVVRHFGADYVKLWPGQDGWDYPFQVDHATVWRHSIEGVGALAAEHPDLKFVIEYKPREPRVHMSYSSVARTLLGIEKIGLPNVGILLDFGHALFGGESPADSAQLAIDHGRLFGMDVNDNLRGWDDDMVAGTVHPIELFEFFWTLRKNNWEGVWQLDQFPFREDSVQAARLAIDFLKRVQRGLDALDVQALTKAQAEHDALTAQRLAQEALYGSR
jgi:xylose isomerase